MLYCRNSIPRPGEPVITRRSLLLAGGIRPACPAPPQPRAGCGDQESAVSGMVFTTCMRSRIPNVTGTHGLRGKGVGTRSHDHRLKLAATRKGARTRSSSLPAGKRSYQSRTLSPRARPSSLKLSSLAYSVRLTPEACSRTRYCRLYPRRCVHRSPFRLECGRLSSGCHCRRCGARASRANINGISDSASAILLGLRGDSDGGSKPLPVASASPASCAARAKLARDGTSQETRRPCSVRCLTPHA